MRLAILAIVVALAGTAAGQPTKGTVDLRSGVIVGGLPLPEHETRIHTIRLTARLIKGVEGKGTLELDPNTPTYSEFGYLTYESPLAWIKLECTLKFVRNGTVRIRESPRVAAPEIDEEWSLYEVTGPKITSKLFVATLSKGNWQSGRFLVQDKDGKKVVYAVQASAPPPPEPCHPGCFPAGASIRVPSGTRAVESIRAGDLVTVIGADGRTSSAKVDGVFTTRNRLVKIATDAGDLLTTETQPLALAEGGLRAAGELKAGNRIWRWDGKERLAVKVHSVAPTEREEPVFNLILADPALFVADGFLARSKPPAPVRGGPNDPRP
jgi:hypothetical protein